ncbi:hypothetical protein N7513_001597 [Penicillium frequentans]|uniref:Uncharacterized protein n=1 Tax=Penicillium frequentans TaxID=3151616 RepID=A0AAD6CPV4_9EURO|nr:hypothetical protein N7494_008571 [Penicillium glabrum]KAJ5565355.1 hypothetical protein N7513_001597 [Penicillium glabrum]
MAKPKYEVYTHRARDLVEINNGLAKARLCLSLPRIAAWGNQQTGTGAYNPCPKTSIADPRENSGTWPQCLTEHVPTMFSAVMFASDVLQG